MNIHILFNYIDLSRQATANFQMHWPRFSLKLVVTCVINWQAGTKLIRHGEERDGFVTLNTAAIKKRYDEFKQVGMLVACCSGNLKSTCMRVVWLILTWMQVRIYFTRNEVNVQIPLEFKWEMANEEIYYNIFARFNSTWIRVEGNQIPTWMQVEW